jgi:hypothetical protein
VDVVILVVRLLGLSRYCLLFGPVAALRLSDDIIVGDTVWVPDATPTHSRRMAHGTRR